MSRPQKARRSTQGQLSRGMDASCCFIPLLPESQHPDPVVPRPVARRLASLPHHVPIVLDVVRQAMRLDRAEASFLKILPRFLLAPHGAQTLAALRQ
jgi:hypothetical protein